MKKIFLIPVLILTLFAYVNNVKADTESTDIYLTQYYSYFDEYISDSLNSSSELNTIIDYYNNNFSSTHPYYIIQVNRWQNNPHPYYLQAFTNIFDFNLLYLGIGYEGGNEDDFWYFVPSNSKTLYINNNNEITYYTLDDAHPLYSGPLTTTKRFPIAYSNFDLVINSIKEKTTNADLPYNLKFPSFSSQNNDFSFEPFTISVGDIFPSYSSLSNGSYIPSPFYQEINLNNYSYVALSLKDYSLRNDEINQFYTDIYTKGQLCLTPVYNYGMTEKKEYYSGYQVQRCSLYYDNYTPVRTYILKQDLENHSIYYLKSYDTSKDNFVKVDTNIFDITYFTSENEDNPSVIINGRSYPTIPYSNLTDTSTKSEEEGYVSGQVCVIGDINCYNKATGSNFTDIFSSPLELLKSVWSSITSVFSIITEFITILPPQLQTFLYLSFMLAVVLGILKIIL